MMSDKDEQTTNQSEEKSQATTNMPAVPPGNTTYDLRGEAARAMEKARQQQAQAASDSAAAQRAHFTDAMQLRLEGIGETFEPIVMAVEQELIIGRGDNVTDYVPDIDLTPHGAYRLGLSRRHASIERRGNRLYVKDLNSRNGTFVNGVEAVDGETLLLKDGDEVRFGNLAMQVRFQPRTD